MSHKNKILSTRNASFCIYYMVNISSTICPGENGSERKNCGIHINKQIDMPSMYKAPDKKYRQEEGRKIHGR